MKELIQDQSDMPDLFGWWAVGRRASVEEGDGDGVGPVGCCTSFFSLLRAFRRTLRLARTVLSSSPAKQKANHL